jgi:dipeptidyl aminopeptidase/acylaminoacyl peptidase
MRRLVALSAVGAAYTLLLGFVAVLVLSVTAAVADGWALRQAAQRYADSSPRFSPDGSRIAWIRRDEQGSELWVMQADGSSQQPVAAATRFRWTRDGAALLFSRGGPRVFRVDPDVAIPTAAGRAELARGTARDESHGRRVSVRDHRLWLRLPGGGERRLT